MHFMKAIGIAISLAASAVAHCDDVPCCSRKICVYTPEETTEEKHCWCVECKAICIPQIRCPWEPGGSKLTCFNWFHGDRNERECSDICGSSRGVQPRCGEIKHVRDLKKQTYEVEACKWKAEIRRLPPCCDCPNACGCVR